MTNMHDRAQRQQLIERYLDADTTTEEERMLADFYQQTTDSLSADEEAVRQLLLDIPLLSSDFTLSDEKADEFDRIMAATPPKARRIALWHWLAAACAAAIIAVLLAPPKGTANTDETPTQVARQEQERSPENKEGHASEVLPQPFLAALPSPTPAATNKAEAEDDQSDLISIDSVFGVTSRRDPLEEYTALSEKLKQECDAVFKDIHEDFN